MRARGCERSGGWVADQGILRLRQHKMGGTEDNRREFLKKFSAKILSSACFEASARPPILRCRSLRIPADPPPCPPDLSQPLALTRWGSDGEGRRFRVGRELDSEFLE